MLDAAAERLTDPKVADSGDPLRAEDRVALRLAGARAGRARDVGVQHLLCQTGFGAWPEQNIIDAPVRRTGDAGVRRLTEAGATVEAWPTHQLSWLSGRCCAEATWRRRRGRQWPLPRS